MHIFGIGQLFVNPTLLRGGEWNVCHWVCNSLVITINTITLRNEDSLYDFFARSMERIRKDTD